MISDIANTEKQPILAQQAFLTLANKWQEMAKKTATNEPLPGEADNLALACLLLAVEWGRAFDSSVLNAIADNENLASEHWSLPAMSELESLVWGLCMSAMREDPWAHRGPINRMIGNLTHPKSDFRIWAMKICWMVRSWFSAEDIAPLLQNVTDTLGGVRLAMGLARGFCGSDEELEQRMILFEPEEYADQFAERIERFRNEGFALSQAHFFSMESDCRHLIEKSILGLAWPG